jgi:hypothetical protein
MQELHQISMHTLLLSRLEFLKACVTKIKEGKSMHFELLGDFYAMKERKLIRIK